MNLKRFFTIVLTIGIVFLVRNISFSRQDNVTVPTSGTLLSISHRISNSLSESSATKRADRLINRFLKKWEVAGATVAVVKDKKLVFAKGYGYADLENKKKVEPSHLFRVASVSKLITATAIMKLKEEGRLHLDNYVFGEFGLLNDTIYSNIRDKRAKKITVEHLLRHTSGFSNRYGDPMFLPTTIAKKMKVKLPISAETTIRFALSRRLHFNPGAGSSYSNLGYVILEKIIEKVSGQKYEDYVQTHVLNPAGVFDMHLGKSLRKDRYYNEVKYYEQSNADKVKAFDNSNKMVYRSNGGNNIEALGGAGGWVASAAELMRFFMAIDGDDTYDDILFKKNIEYMTKPSEKGFMPIGWKASYAGNWWRTGSFAGTSALLKHSVNGYDFVIITNTSTWRGADFTKDLSVLMSRFVRTVKEWPCDNLFDNFELNSFEMTYVDLKHENLN